MNVNITTFIDDRNYLHGKVEIGKSNIFCSILYLPVLYHSYPNQ